MSTIEATKTDASMEMTDKLTDDECEAYGAMVMRGKTEAGDYGEFQGSTLRELADEIKKLRAALRPFGTKTLAEITFDDLLRVRALGLEW
jgi:hypothetical protein